MFIWFINKSKIVHTSVFPPAGKESEMCFCAFPDRVRTRLSNSAFAARTAQKNNIGLDFSTENKRLNTTYWASFFFWKLTPKHHLLGLIFLLKTNTKTPFIGLHFSSENKHQNTTYWASFFFWKTSTKTPLLGLDFLKDWKTSLWLTICVMLS